MTIELPSSLTAAEIRTLCRDGAFDGSTAGAALGYVQANLVVLGQCWARDFEEFCRLNPRPCPILEITEPGDPEPRRVARGADLRTDLPRYRVFRNGKCVETPTSIERVWKDDSVAFLIGCSFTFERALLEADLPVRHIELRINVPMYRTNVACTPVGPFSSPLVVSMRPMTPGEAEIARRVTAMFPKAHGGPVHIGDPGSLGINDLQRPDFGDAVPVYDHEVPVFWACGVTPLLAIEQARPDLAITHDPGHMFVTDIHDIDLRVEPP